MTNRTHLIREGINDAYSETFQTKWERLEFDHVVGLIDRSMPSRWGKVNPVLTRLYARAYACAEFASDPNLYRRDGLL